MFKPKGVELYAKNQDLAHFFSLSLQKTATNFLKERTVNILIGIQFHASKTQFFRYKNPLSFTGFLCHDMFT